MVSSEDCSNTSQQYKVEASDLCDSRWRRGGQQLPAMISQYYGMRPSPVDKRCGERRWAVDDVV